jgi:hypothetical protein
VLTIVIYVDFDFLKVAKMELKNAVPALVITFISSIILLGSAADLCNQVGSECAGKEVCVWAPAADVDSACAIWLHTKRDKMTAIFTNPSLEFPNGI